VASQETGTQDRLLLLDGHSLAYRAFFALPIENFSTTTGQPTNAVYGFTAMLINVLRDEKPTHVAVAFDRGEPTFRHEQWVEYKANRRETPEDFRSQLSLIFEVLDALGSCPRPATRPTTSSPPWPPRPRRRRWTSSSSPATATCCSW